MPRTVRPHRGVAPLEQVVVDLGDAPGAGLPSLSQHRLEVARLRRMLLDFLIYLVAQPTVDLRRGLALHIPGDVGVDVQGGGGRHMAQHGREGLHIHAAFQGQGGESVPQVYLCQALTKNN